MKSSTKIYVVLAAVALAFLLMPTMSAAQGVLFVTGDKVGIGTDTPDKTFEVVGGDMLMGTNNRWFQGRLVGGGIASIFWLDTSDATNFAAPTGRSLAFRQGPTIRMIIRGSGGYLGVGNTNPQYPIHMGSGAHVTVGGVWTDASSRDLKENIRQLSTNDALAALGNLNPVRFNYRVEADEEYVGFIAEDVPDLVSTSGRKSLAPMDIVAVLTKVVQEQRRVVQEQQSTIEDLQAAVARLEASN